MGLSTAALSELGLIERKHDIGVMLTLLANDKKRLAGDMQKVSKDYQAALNAKVFTWSNNGGASYIELSYNNLMRPSAMNQNKPYLLTDSYGRVVIDNGYKKYAEMISPDGKGGVEWESKRAEIISALTGIPAEKISGTQTNQEDLWDLEKEIHDLEKNKPEEPLQNGSAVDFLGLLNNNANATNGIKFSTGTTWENAYRANGTINLGNLGSLKTNLSNILTQLSTGLNIYLYPEDQELLTESMDLFVDEMGITAGIGDNKDKEAKTALNDEMCPLAKNQDGTYSINVKKMMDWIIEQYSSLGGPVDTNVANGDPILEWRDIGSSRHNNWIEENAKWQEEYNAKTSEYESLKSSDNSLLTAEQENQIEFYDILFSSIAEKGWVLNESINDQDYLNQMLQNNIYTITTVERTSAYDDKEGDYDWLNDYDTNIASNCTNIFAVSDNDMREEALVVYEYEKSIINEKEARIDTRMKNLETELDAVNTMLQAKEQEKKDNIDRTFSAMG